MIDVETNGAIDPEEAVRYAKQRRAFGKTISEFQAIQWMLADMQTEIEAARCLVYHAAWLRDQGSARLGPYASRAKLYAGEMVNRVVYKAVQIHGSVGYSRETDVERMYRDARVISIYEGTSEIQRMIIARDLLAAAPGVEMREMERNGRNSFCCGAGGGRMWMEEQRGTRINHERTRQALETGASVVATGCPFCMTMLKDGLDDAGASTRAADPVVAMDIAEILAGSLAPAATDGRRALPVVH